MLKVMCLDEKKDVRSGELAKLLSQNVAITTRGRLRLYAGFAAAF